MASLLDRLFWMFFCSFCKLLAMFHLLVSIMDAAGPYSPKIHSDVLMLMIDWRCLLRPMMESERFSCWRVFEPLDTLLQRVVFTGGLTIWVLIWTRYIFLFLARHVIMILHPLRPGSCRCWSIGPPDSVTSNVSFYFPRSFSCVLLK